MRGMNQAICIQGGEGAEMTFFGFWSHPVYIPVIPDYTERVELNAGLKMFVRVHLRLGMNQRSRHVSDRPKSARSRFHMRVHTCVYADCCQHQRMCAHMRLCMCLHADVLTCMHMRAFINACARGTRMWHVSIQTRPHSACT